MSAPTMKPWPTTHLLRDVLATMLEGEKPLCRYEGNGVQVLLTVDALVTYELDDRNPRNRAWVPTERVVFTASEDDLERRRWWTRRHTEEQDAWQAVEDYGDRRNTRRAYFDARYNRIDEATVLLLAKARGGVRPLGAVPTVGMEAGF